MFSIEVRNTLFLLCLAGTAAAADENFAVGTVTGVFLRPHHDVYVEARLQSNSGRHPGWADVRIVPADGGHQRSVMARLAPNTSVAVGDVVKVELNRVIKKQSYGRPSAENRIVAVLSKSGPVRAASTAEHDSTGAPAPLMRDCH